MADVLNRGPVGSDEAMLYEVHDLFDLLRRSLAAVRAADPASGVAAAELLESVANRLLDMSEALNERYLDACEVQLPDDIDQRT